jgi:hypothetical protein
MLTVKNCAPNDSTYSLVAGLVSKHLTMAPMFLAVAIDDNPATPAPITKTLAGGSLPAAVIYPIKALSNRLAASTTALYPEILAMDDKASKV